MNAPCRDDLCALQKEAWLPAGAELGFQPCRWLLERGNPVQHSQARSTHSKIWDVLMAAASLLWEESLHTMLCGSVQTHTGGFTTVLRIVSSVGLRQELQCCLWRRTSLMYISASAFGLPGCSEISVPLCL